MPSRSISISVKVIFVWEGNKWLSTQIKLISEASVGICSLNIKNSCSDFVSRLLSFQSLFCKRAFKLMARRKEKCTARMELALESFLCTLLPCRGLSYSRFCSWYMDYLLHQRWRRVSRSLSCGQIILEVKTLLWRWGGTPTLPQPPPCSRALCRWQSLHLSEFPALIQPKKTEQSTCFLCRLRKFNIAVCSMLTNLCLAGIGHWTNGANLFCILHSFIQYV